MPEARLARTRAAYDTLTYQPATAPKWSFVSPLPPDLVEQFRLMNADMASVLHHGSFVAYTPRHTVPPPWRWWWQR